MVVQSVDHNAVATPLQRPCNAPVSAPSVAASRFPRDLGPMRITLRPLALASIALGLLAPPGAAQRAAFKTLLDDHWQWSLRQSPILATTLGEHRYDRELGDLSLAAMDRRARDEARFLSRANGIDTADLTPTERVTRAILRRDLAESIEGNRFGQRAILFTTYYGWHTGFADLGVTHPFRDRADYEAYVARLAAYPRYNRGAIETTRAALAGGFAQPCAPFVGYERTISGVMDSTPDKSRFLEPFARRPSFIPDSDWTTLRQPAVAAVRDSVYPAYAALLDFYRTDYAPHCRST